MPDHKVSGGNMTLTKALLSSLILGACVGAAACDRSFGSSGQTASRPTGQASPENRVKEGAAAPRQDLASAWEHLHKGQQLLSSGKNEEAVAEYQQAIELGLDRQDTRMDLAEAFTRLNRNQDAAEQYRLLIRRDDGDWRAHWALAQLLILKLNDYEEGLREVTISKELDKGDADIAYTYDYYIAKAYDGMGQYDKALDHYKIFMKGEAKNSSGSDELKEVTQRVKEIKEKLRLSSTNR
jgi:tetratricopeptide (TPR) repeat protein